MSKSTGLFAGTVVLALAAGASSQTPAAPTPPQPGNAVLIAQYECNPADLAKVDQIIKEVAGPVLSRYIAEGKVTTWGLLGVSVGGPVNRTIYVWAKDVPTLVTARQTYLPEIMAKPGWSEMARMCPRQQTAINTMVANPSTK